MVKRINGGMPYIPYIPFCVICQFDNYYKIIGSLTVVLLADFTKIIFENILKTAYGEIFRIFDETLKHRLQLLSSSRLESEEI